MACIGNQLFGGDFNATLDKTEADIFELKTKWNWKWVF